MDSHSAALGLKTRASLPEMLCSRDPLGSCGLWVRPSRFTLTSFHTYLLEHQEGFFPLFQYPKPLWLSLLEEYIQGLEYQINIQEMLDETDRSYQSSESAYREFVPPPAHADEIPAWAYGSPRPSWHPSPLESPLGRRSPPSELEEIVLPDRATVTFSNGVAAFAASCLLAPVLCLETVCTRITRLF